MTERAREAVDAYRETVVAELELESAHERRRQILAKLTGDEWQSYVEARRDIEAAVWDCRRARRERNLDGKAWSRFWRLRISRAGRTPDA